MKQEKKLTKTEIKRASQKEALIDTAQKVIAQNGLSGLKARDLADEIGVALGSIYNLVSDLDELVLLVNSRTINKLNQKLDMAVNNIAETAALNRLIAAGQAYHHFAQENYYLWRALFDHRLSGDKPIPEWISNQRMQPFTRVVKPLKHLMPDATDQDIALFSQTLFSSIHGMVLIGLENHDVGVRHEKLDSEISHLITIIAKGLK